MCEKKQYKLTKTFSHLNLIQAKGGEEKVALMPVTVKNFYFNGWWY